MIRLLGASYVDALPSGSFVALYEGSHLETHLGPVELPPGEAFGLLFLRCSDVGGFHFAGMLYGSPPGHPHLREWRNGQWSDPFPTPCGRVVYDHTGQIRDTLPAGYQFTGDDGIPVSRIETYPPLDELSEWTFTAGIRIGQGHDGGGVRVFVDGVLRELEPGNCWFVNGNRDGTRMAIAFWKIGEGAVIWQGTLTALRALPIVTAPSPLPVPVPPEPSMSLPDPAAVLAILTEERDKYPSKIDDVPSLNKMCGHVLNATARQFPFMGMHRKDGEKAAPVPGLTVTVSRDTLRYLPPGDTLGWWSDVLGATGAGLATPQAPEWKRSTDDARSFVAPTGVTPPPNPPPPPPTRSLEDRVLELERWRRS